MILKCTRLFGRGDEQYAEQVGDTAVYNKVLHEMIRMIDKKINEESLNSNMLIEKVEDGLLVNVTLNVTTEWLGGRKNE